MEDREREVEERAGSRYEGGYRRTITFTHLFEPIMGDPPASRASSSISSGPPGSRGCELISMSTARPPGVPRGDFGNRVPGGGRQIIPDEVCDWDQRHLPHVVRDAEELGRLALEHEM